MFAESGKQFGQIQISKGTDILVSFLLDFRIEKNIISETAVESKDEYGILDGLINDARDAVTSANNAASSANNAANSANKAASSANAAATAANNAAEELQEKVNAGDFTASVTVGTVTTGNPGTQASVVNSGTDKDAVLDFTIPRGDTGSVENISSQPVTFAEASNNNKIASGESLSILFGKTSRLFTRVGTAETNITDIQSDISISEETIAAFKALGWTPPSGGAVIESLLNLIFDRAHPVGSYYWSSDSTNPSKLFGGTWEQVTDKFILAAGDTYKAGTTGGEATHVLTADEMPRHDGHLQKNSGSMSGGNTNMYLPTTSLNNYISGRGWNNDGGGEMYPVGVSRGNNEPHNNMPPYEVAYCWKRTA
ncbi:phage baseplate protein [Gallibacter intestinalis]|uniref:Baseplate structural protein Gp10 C-terminal domain-containing protein n=1 Tax=Gallibacter intestinalis TaxID=2779356 RepID=A0ABR9QY83_9FIRM|nr:hypothetical protein [Gallibacter intestinalis]MBE5035806.1 hypothetical protein [Gallibacter intestinalis]